MIQSNYDVSIILSTFQSDQYIDKYYENICELLNVASIQLVHICNDVTDLERNVSQQFSSLQYADSASDFEYICVCVERETLYASWNRAIKLATSKLVTISNVDDYRYADGLLKQIEFLSRLSGPVLLGSKFNVRTSEELYSPQFSGVVPDSEYFSGMYVGPFFMWINPVLCGHDPFYFDEQFKVAGDFDFQIRFASKYSVDILNVAVGEYLSLQEGLSTGSIIQEIEGQVIYSRYCVVDKALPLASMILSKYDYKPSQFMLDKIAFDVKEMVSVNEICVINSSRKSSFVHKIRSFARLVKIYLKIFANAK